MSDSGCLPTIIPLFDESVDSQRKSLYADIIRKTLYRLLPSSAYLPFLTDSDLFDDHKKAFFSLLPLFNTSLCHQLPGNLSCFVVSRERPGSFKFFYEMMTRWLVPGKRLDSILLYTVDFKLPDYGEEVYTLCELVLSVENANILEQVQRNLPIVETEVRLGMQSSYYARRILEIKGLSADSKTALIQEQIAYLIHKLPHLFDFDLLTEMQHVLVICNDEFKALRESRHLGRIISMHYLFRKQLRETVRTVPHKRHLHLKIFRATLRENDISKPVLGILVGINFLQDKEVFEERHLLNAVQNYLPTIQSINHSFFSHRRGNESICTLYLEIEKLDGQEFSAAEIRMLRQELPSDLRDRIEHMMHPVFMPRNEEEIIRNIFTLSNQIKYLHDLPQLILSFDKQTHQDLFFTLILVKVRDPGSASLQDIFKTAPTIFRYLHERSKGVGFLRKKYVKEAAVFSVKLPKQRFLRRDNSIDLSKARQVIVAEVTNIIGEVRDYNGGLISKQHELLCALREELDTSVKYNDLLLENFFYSLIPDVMRTLLDPKELKPLFIMLLEAIDLTFFNGMNYLLTTHREMEQVFVMIKTEDRFLRESISKALARLDIPSSKLANSYVVVYDIAYMGYIYLCDDPDKQIEFCQTLQASLVSSELRSSDNQLVSV